MRKRILRKGQKMKIAPSYISKERLLKKIAKRSKERIAEHTVVSSAFKPENSKMIQENLDPIARYAERHKIDIEFEPNIEEAGTTKMNIFKRTVKFMDMHDGSDPFIYMDQDFAGSAILPSKMDNKNEFLKTIRTNAAKILYENK